MKKKILIITSVIVLILAVIASIIFIPKMINKNDNNMSGDETSSPAVTDELKAGSGMLEIRTIDEIKSCADAYGFTVTTYEEDDKISVNDAICCDVPLQINYFPSANEEDLSRVEVYYIPFSDEYSKTDSPKFNHSGEELKVEVDKFFEMIDSTFNVSVNGQYFIISTEGELLDNKLNTSYDALIAGKACIDFTLRDSNGYYWILSSGLSEEGLVYFTFTNYFDLSIYSENIAHVTVQ